MHKELFDDAIGEVPPSTVDVDAAIVRGRRAARIRRVVNPAVAAGVAVVLLTGVVAYTMTRDDGTSGTTMGTQRTSAPETTQQAPPVVLPEACKRTDLETPAHLDARLTAVAKEALAAQRPDLQLSINGGVAPPGSDALEFYQVPANKPICQGDTYASAIAITHGHEGPGNVMIVLEPSHHDASTLKCDSSIGEKTFCAVETNANGDVIRKTSYGTNGMLGNNVDIIRPDGTSVMINADNIPASGTAPTGSAPPLSNDQLSAIGTAPGMTLFP